MKNKICVIISLFFLIVSTFSTVLAMNVTPLIIKREIFIYEYGSEISTNIGDYVTANEAVLSQASLNMSKVKNGIGLYPVVVTYLGKDYKFYIKVEDTTKPKVKLKSSTFNYLKNEKIDPLDLIESVDDNSDVVAYFIDDDGNRQNTLKYSESGSYIVKMEVEDASGNQAAVLRVKIVVSNTKKINPTLIGVEDIELTKGSTFSPLKGVEATDGKGNDITSQIKILKNNVNTKKEGTYNVIYFVSNNDGNNLQVTRKVKVVDLKGE